VVLPELGLPAKAILILGFLLIHLLSGTDRAVLPKVIVR